MVRESAVKGESGGPGEYAKGDPPTALTTLAMADPPNSPVTLRALFDCFECDGASPGAVTGTGADARMAARKPSISSGLKTAVLEEVMTTTEWLRLVTYQIGR